MRLIYVEGKGGFDGIGFVFSADDPYCGVDFDECLDAEGKIADPFVSERLERLDSYTEKSVSGTGLHVIVKGVSGRGLKRGKIEVYDRLRYFTFSGAVGKRREIHERQNAIDELKRAVKPEPEKPQIVIPQGNGHTVSDDWQRIAFNNPVNGAEIQRLWTGDWSGYPSPSEASLALCSHLAFYLKRDPAQIDSAFRQSGLMRGKWDQRRGDSTWGLQTIEKALSTPGDVYSGNGHKTDFVGPAIPSDPEKQKDPPLPRFRFTTLDALLAEPKEEIAYVWDRVLPRGGFSMIAAKPKVGKSTLARGLGVAVATGDSFFGRATHKGLVVYLCLEEKRAEVADHFRRMGADGANILIYTGKTPRDALLALQTAIDEHSPALVIIDPLSRFVRVADFNSYAEVTRQLEPLIDMARLSECQTHIMALHHNGKNGEREGGDALLGSTGFFGAVDTLLTMRKRERARTVESVQRYGEDLPETIVHLDPLTRIVEAAGDMKEFALRERKQAVLEALGSDPLAEAAIKELVGGTNKGLTSKAVRALFEEGQLQRAGGGKKGDPFLYKIVGLDAENCSTDPQFSESQKPAKSPEKIVGFVGLSISTDPENPQFVKQGLPDEIFIPADATDAEIEALLGGP